MDHNIFITIAKINRQIINIFVDNNKVTHIKKLGHIIKVKLEFMIAFEIVDIGRINFYLGLKFERDQAKKTLKLLQLAYINKILTKYYFDQTKLYNTLMKERILLSNKNSKVI